MKKLLFLFFFIVAFFVFPTEILADECPDGNTTLAVDDTIGTLTITIPSNSFLANTDYQLYYLQDKGPNIWFDWGNPVKAIDSNNDNSVDTLVFAIPFSEIAANRSFYDNGSNAGVDFRISEGTNSYTNYFCSIATSLSADNANKIFNYLQSLNLVPAAPAPAPGVGGTAPATATPVPVPGFPGCMGIETGLGPIPTDPECLVKWVLKYAILMGGGIAFLLSVFGGVSIILAGGNPEKINAGKEIIGSALTGLLFIIFSVFLLRFIGYDILQLPGFGK